MLLNLGIRTPAVTLLLWYILHERYPERTPHPRPRTPECPITSLRQVLHVSAEQPSPVSRFDVRQ